MAQRSELTFDVSTCPRCGAEHKDLQFIPFGSPVSIPTITLVGQRVDTVDLTLWEFCPTKAEPILGRVLPTGEVEVR